MTPQPLKIRADIEMKCFQYDGVLHIKEQGIHVLNAAIKASTEAIDLHKGKLTVKEAPRAESEHDDKLLAEHMAKLRADNEEVSGDEETEEEEDIGMGEIDLDNAGVTE
ncbi:hypothetical protein AMTR_s00154p00040680 [Amborella trichopoda]|uniref:Uncharacterized protein n=1 Tax=Amborella trichopoda TaxID=13333 RepID=W1PIH6_AMBTC|nr:hypothetical protein AMTR_s00154p00040680 [Amborella trichopoda]